MEYLQSGSEFDRRIGIVSGCTCRRRIGPDAKDEFGRRFVSTKYKRLRLPKRRGVRLPRSGSGVVQCCPRGILRERKGKDPGKAGWNGIGTECAHVSSCVGSRRGGG